MNFFINEAHAQGATANSDPFGFLIPMIVIFVGFYFLLIRPQQKRQKAHNKFDKSKICLRCNSTISVCFFQQYILSD